MQYHEVDLPAFAAAHAGGATVIDVREPYEYTAGHVPGARLVPMEQLPRHADELRRNAAVYVICASGNRSLAAADYLSRLGVRAYSVAGGTGGWQRSGRPLVRGQHASTGSNAGAGSNAR
jgi:rhodanese-related sulfurtransferase